MSEITPNTPNPVREDAYVEELSEKLGIDPQYIPKSPVWRNEEEIKAIAEMFANMSGSSGGGLVVNKIDDALDKTWQEIYNATISGRMVVVTEDDSAYVVTEVVHGKAYLVFAGELEFVTSTASGYPAIDSEG